MFLHCCQDYLKMKKSWKKRVSGCNSVDLKAMKSISSNRICFKVQITLGVQLGLDNQ